MAPKELALGSSLRLATISRVAESESADGFSIPACNLPIGLYTRLRLSGKMQTDQSLHARLTSKAKSKKAVFSSHRQDWLLLEANFESVETMLALSMHSPNAVYASKS